MSSSSSSVSPHQRSAQQRTERQRVALVGEDAGHRNEILDLLAPVEALARLSRDRDAALLEGFLVAPELAAGRRKQRDIAGPAQALLAALRIADRLAADQACAHVGDDLGLAVPLLRGGGLAVLVGHFNIQGCDTTVPQPAPVGRDRGPGSRADRSPPKAGVSKRAFTYSMIGAQERKLVAMERTPSAVCTRKASRART